MRLIDADALFTAFENAAWYDNNDRDLVAEDILMDAPTIESKASEGRWKGAGMGDYRCSLCDGIVNGKYKFCPYCGDRKEDTA